MLKIKIFFFIFFSFFFSCNCQKTYPCLPDGELCGNFESPNCCRPLVCEKTNDPANMRCSGVKSCVAKNGQCGGMFNMIGFIWNGNEKCCTGLTCKGTSKYYKQCLP